MLYVLLLCVTEIQIYLYNNNNAYSILNVIVGLIQDKENVEHPVILSGVIYWSHSGEM